MRKHAHHLIMKPNGDMMKSKWPFKAKLAFDQSRRMIEFIKDSTLPSWRMLRDVWSTIFWYCCAAGYPTPGSPVIIELSFSWQVRKSYNSWPVFKFLLCWINLQLICYKISCFFLFHIGIDFSLLHIYKRQNFLIFQYFVRVQFYNGLIFRKFLYSYFYLRVLHHLYCGRQIAA